MTEPSLSPAALAYQGERGAPVRSRRGVRLASLAALVLLVGVGVYFQLHRAPVRVRHAILTAPDVDLSGR